MSTARVSISYDDSIVKTVNNVVKALEEVTGTSITVTEVSTEEEGDKGVMSFKFTQNKVS